MTDEGQDGRYQGDFSAELIVLLFHKEVTNANTLLKSKLP